MGGVVGQWKKIERRLVLSNHGVGISGLLVATRLHNNRCLRNIERAEGTGEKGKTALTDPRTASREIRAPI